MKFLAIDYGQKRSGLAVSDAGGRMAFPRSTLIMRTKDEFFQAILHIIQTEAIEGIVIGLPLHENGEDSLTTRQVRNMTKKLQRRTSLPLYFCEEYLTSFEAKEDLFALGYSQKKVQKNLDQQAAVRILASFLEQDPQTWRQL